MWKKEIIEKFFDLVFFKANTIILDIISGKLKDLTPYKDLGFWDAELKYDERRIFQEMKSIKTYKNGYKWINVGPRCYLMGKYMKNCGSSGVMSSDKDRTLLGLFDINNKPHVIVTYSPNEKRISGEEGVYYSEVKPEYHEYVLDLAETLGVDFDTSRSKSQLLQLKYILKGKISNIKLVYKTSFDEYFRFNIGNKIYYTNGTDVVSLEDVLKIRELVKQKKIELKCHPQNIIKAMFNHYNQSIIQSFGVKYTSIYHSNEL
jgi:hypothetical protein